VLASNGMNHKRLFILDVTEQKWEIYPVVMDNYYTSFGKLIALRDNLYYFHELANPSYPVAINRIFRNGTTIDLKMEKPFLDEYDLDAVMIDHIQLAPFSRRFLKNVKNYGVNLEYTKFD
jgi:hypothetical protein